MKPKSLFPTLPLMLAALLLSSSPSSSYASRLEPLQNNGYDILVGIHDSVKEDANIIANLKDILTQASVRMYKATSKRAFIHTVSILVPPSWRADAKYEKPGKNNYADAEIKVAASNRMYGNAPYVKALSGDCGAAGEHIHLTPEYVNDVDGARQYYGDAGKVIVHEWGHHRWGLPEEYPDPTASLNEKFYFSMKTKKYEAIRCSLSMVGRVLRPTGKGKYKVCRLHNGWPDHEDCQFYPGFKINNPAKASMMDRQGTDGVEAFCDKTSDRLHEHNYESNNEMNRKCGGRSAWEVMKDHADFKDGNNPARDVKDAELVPTFKLLRKSNKNCRVSFVIDRSGSMSGNKIRDLKKGLKKFIENTARDGMEVGMSSFSSGGSVDCNMQRINGPDDRRNFVNRCLNQRATGGTSIGSGLLSGLQNLGRDTEGGRIFILTDGAQSSGRGPTDPYVLSALDNSGAAVDVVCYTQAADKRMLSLAKRYNGAFYYDSDKAVSNSLNEAFLKNPCDDSDDGIGGDQSIISHAGTISPRDEPVTGHFSLDESIGSNFRVLVDYDSNGGNPGIDVTLTSPDATVFTKTSPEYVDDPTFGTITISIPEDKTRLGKWLYEIQSSSNRAQKYAINVIAGARTSVVVYGRKLVGLSAPKPITLKASLQSLQATFPAPMAVFAEVSRGGEDPVLNLQVTASVDRPNENSLFRFPLKDDGVGADRKKDDGIYSGYFSAYTATGRYSFSVMAEDENGTAVVKQYTKAEQWGAAPAIDENNIDVPQRAEFSLQPIRGGVTRSAPVGAAEMAPAAGESAGNLNQRLRNGEDMIPPAKITDLKMKRVKTTPHSLELSWTAPWDETESGRDGKYYSIELENEDGMNTTIEARNSAGVAGEQMAITIDLKASNLWHEDVAIGAAVIAIDAAGNRSPASNRVTMQVKPALETPVEGDNTTVVVIAVVACVSVVAAVVAWVVVKKKKSLKIANKPLVNEDAGL